VAVVVGSVLVYRFWIHPGLETLFGLGAESSSIVRRFGILIAIVSSYATFARFYERRRVRELAPRGIWILVGAAVGAATIGLTIGALYATGHYQLTGYRGWSSAAGILGLIAIAAVVEEIVYRGLLFRIAEEHFGTRVALVSSAAIFGAMHLANDGARWITLASVTLLGLMWAGVFLVSRNLWVAAAHHMAWNATIFLVGAPLSGSEAWRVRAPFETIAVGSEVWTGGAFGPEDSWINLVASVAICAILWRLARNRGKVVSSRVS
jgi:membrane protease YdiL (CAAX protease family)